MAGFFIGWWYLRSLACSVLVVGFLVTGLLIYFAQKHGHEIKAARDAE
jgi:hypothetical protein